MSTQATAKGTKIHQALCLANEAAFLRDTYGGHWNEHPEYPASQWKAEVENGDTRLGYWEWIVNCQQPISAEPKP